jgi:glucosamine-6-phosphate deaminase
LAEPEKRLYWVQEDRMPALNIEIFDSKMDLGAAAARKAAAGLRAALARQDSARLILATGASQFEMLDNLVRQPGIDWSRVTCFHLDEYCGLPESHPASFRRYLKERFVSRVPGLGAFQFVKGDAADLPAELNRLAGLILAAPVDVACVGIGENGHLAFNDPPADFEIDDPYLVVSLDEACRRQQLGEGWFPSLEAVPDRAISMSIRQIMRSRQIVCTVPDARKARAVAACLGGLVSPAVPASILQTHPDCFFFLDREAAAGLKAV